MEAVRGYGQHTSLIIQNDPVLEHAASHNIWNYGGYDRQSSQCWSTGTESSGLEIDQMSATDDTHKFLTRH